MLSREEKSVLISENNFLIFLPFTNMNYVENGLDFYI